MATRGRGLSLVVTGTGRCGTKFTSKVLESVGVHTMHQFIFRPGRGGPGSPEVLPELTELVTVEDIRYRVKGYKASKWGPQAETSWLAAPYLDVPEMRGVVRVHLVREPRKVINSLVKCEVFERRDRYGLYTDFAYHWVPQMRQESTPIRRAGRFYVNWNRMIEPHADIFWNVEADRVGLLDLLGIPWEGCDVFNETNYNWRTGPAIDCSLADFDEPLLSELKQITGEYGYEWPDH